MSNKTLYRKYRSLSLNEIVGQHHVTEVLANALKKGRTSHAYLFTGPRGTGKTSIARIFAHNINQIEYQQEGSHLDIIEIDAASNRSIDNIRDLREKIGLAPSSLKYKVYIIDEVHMLTTESFNALLKTLEEPPEHAIFILATTDYHKIPATILSRVQKFFFRPIDEAEVIQHLETICEQEKISFEPEALSLVAKNSEGSMRDALSLLDQLSSFDRKITVALVQESLGLAGHDLVEELCQTICRGSSVETQQQLNNVLQTGANAASVGIQTYDQLKLKVSDLASFEVLASLLELGARLQPKLALELTLIKLNLLLSPNANLKDLEDPKPGDGKNDGEGENKLKSQKKSSSSSSSNSAKLKSKLKSELKSESETAHLKSSKLEDATSKSASLESASLESESLESGILESEATDPKTKTKDSSSKTKKPTLKNKGPKTELAEPKDPKNTESLENSTPTKTLSLTDFKRNWDSIKLAIGKKSPGLRACLNKAEAKLQENGETLNLSVAYPFHKKLLAEPRNLAIIGSCFKDLEMTPPKIELKLNPKLAQQSNQKQGSETSKPALELAPAPITQSASKAQDQLANQVKDSDFSDIISLMGGGEAVQIPAT